MGCESTRLKSSARVLAADGIEAERYADEWAEEA